MTNERGKVSNRTKRFDLHSKTLVKIDHNRNPYKSLADAILLVFSQIWWGLIAPHYLQTVAVEVTANEPNKAEFKVKLIVYFAEVI